ncbi:MAG: ParB N-terminal domain-containing protein, partial [Verrucomicrobiota bacterium]
MPEKRAILIPVAQLLFDPEIQMRTGLDDDHLGDLVAALKAGKDLPPIDVFPAQGDDPIGPNGEHYYIADGNHRGSAYRLADREQIAIYQHTGGRAAAIKFALGANAEHNALRRTNSDKRKAVKT